MPLANRNYLFLHGFKNKYRHFLYMNLCTKQKQIHRLIELTYTYQGEKVGRGWDS